MANKFEKEFNNLPYSTDFWKRRCTILKLIVDMSDEFGIFLIYWSSLDENAKQRERYIIFSLESTIYIWEDIFIKGLIEYSQLDKVWKEENNEIDGCVMYASLANVPVMYPIVMSAIYDNKLHRVQELRL